MKQQQLKFILLIFKLSAAEKSGAAPVLPYFLWQRNH
nr:MAG TPA_asm: hypothetical protein [Caudoviricetes sp.]DAL61639.1 MAG TPA_asm: hypothetical protein [Caudoviricetes sp.]